MNYFNQRTQIAIKMASMKTGLHDLAECPICRTTNAEPKRLPCDHTCCLTCIQQMLDAVRDTALKHGRIPSNEIACPLCRKPVYLLGARPDRLPTNLLAKQLQDMVRKVDNTGDVSACQVCKLESRVADNFCKECKVYMCCDCSEKHTNRNAFKDHSLVKKVLVLCEEHGTQSVYLCTECNIFLCLTCVNDGKCEGHPIKQLSESVQMKMEEIEDLIAKVEMNIETDCGTSNQSIHTILTTSHTRITQAADVKKSIKEWAQTLVDDIRKDEQQLMADVEKWESIFVDVHQNFTTHHTALKEVLIAANEAKSKGVEQMIMAMPAIRSRIPPTPKLPSPEAMNTEVRFIAQKAQKLGEIQFAKSAAPSTPSLTEKWTKLGPTSGRSVTFTHSGNLVVCDYGEKNVVMYDPEGELIASATEKGTQFMDHPQGIVQHPVEPSVIIAEGCAGLLFLDSEDLTFKERVKLEGELYTLCVAVLSNGFVVVGTRNPPTVSIHDDHGKLCKRLTSYGALKQHKISDPYHLTVMANDIIVASMRGNNKVVYFNAKGESLKIVDVSRYGYPCGLSEDPWGDLLVACGIWLGSNHVCRFHNDVSGQVFSDITLKFSQKDVIKELGGVQSVAVKSYQLAVLFSRSLALYEWTS